LLSRLRSISLLHFNRDLTTQDPNISRIQYTHPIRILWVQSSLTHMWQTVFRRFESHSAMRLRGYHILRQRRFSTRDHNFDANAALANMDAVVRLCSTYPGDNPVIPHVNSPHKPFSFRFDDISKRVSAAERVASCDEKCQITGFIDL